MKKIIGLLSIAVFAACGPGQKEMDAAKAKISAFNDHAKAYCKCVEENPKNCGGQSQALMLEHQDVDVEITKTFGSSETSTDLLQQTSAIINSVYSCQEIEQSTQDSTGSN